MPDTTPGGAAARRIAADLAAARAAETMAALAAGSALRSLRDERLFAALGEKSLAALLASRLPACGRVTARTLLEIADGLDGADPAALLSAGLLRLAVIAAAPASARVDLLASVGTVPPRETARAAREAAEREEGDLLRAGGRPAPVRDLLSPPERQYPDPRSPQERASAAESLLGIAASALDDITAAAFTQGRLLASLRDSGDWTALGEGTLEEVAELYLDCSPADLRRALDLDARASVTSQALRRRTGLRALRALASIASDDDRAAAVRLLEADPSLAGDEAADAVRGEGAKAGGRAAAAVADGGREADDPAALLPFDVWFLPDAPAGGAPEFADATPALVAEQVVLRTTRRGGSVLDLMAGAGSVGAVARRLGRSAVSVDRISPSLSPDILAGDARDFAPEAPADLVFLHLPVCGGVRYTERYGRSEAGDLSALDPDGYARAMADVIRHARDVAAPGGWVAICARPSWVGGRFYDWPARIAAAASAAGLSAAGRATAVTGPDARRSTSRAAGFAAARDGRMLDASLSVLLFRRPARRTA
jgi:hypothetical protein